MVSNLVSNNRLGACAKAYTGIAYISLTRDWHYEFVKLLLQPVLTVWVVAVDGGWMYVHNQS